MDYRGNISNQDSEHKNEGTFREETEEQENFADHRLRDLGSAMELGVSKVTGIRRDKGVH